MKKEIIIKLVKVLICAVLLEVIVFNITSYRILSSKNSIEFNKDEIEFFKDEDNSVFLAIPNINTIVKTIKVEFNKNERPVRYTFYYSDDTTENYMELPSKFFISYNDKTKYMPVYLSGVTNKLLLKIDREVYDNDSLVSVTLNEKIPFQFNIIRMIIVFGIFAAIVLYRNLELFKTEKYDPKSMKQEIVIVFIMLLFFLFSIFIIPYSTEEKIEDNKYGYTIDEGTYNVDFVNSLKEGKFYLLESPNSELSNLVDPYDTLERESNFSRNHDYIWDTAYYKGQSYIYFGILPALTVFLPFHLLTDAYLRISIFVLITSLLIFLLLKIIFDKIINRYFKEIPFRLVVLTYIILFSGTFLLYIMASGRVYEAMILSGALLVILGYINIFSSMEYEKYKFKKIMFGSLCLALSVACRPTCLIASLVVIPYFVYLFIKYLKNNKLDLLKFILAVAIPYLVVGILLMCYNHIRFDSVFEFGARYQLTINNMNELKSRIHVLGIGLFTNLFLLPSFNMNFPFFNHINSTIVFNGYYYIEDMIGGLFILSPICFATFFIFRVNKIIKNKELKVLINSLLISALIIELLSSYTAGSIQRYLFDYSWMVVIASICIFFVLYLDLKTDEAKKIFEKIYLIIAIVTLLFGICGAIVSEKSGMEIKHTDVFYNLKYSICFWE